jgi:hypothetical protein
MKKRFNNHKEIASQNGHFYAFGRTMEVSGDNFAEGELFREAVCAKFTHTANAHSLHIDLGYAVRTGSG